MSLKLPKRLSSKKKKPPRDNAQAEVLNKLGLEAFLTAPLDPASMLDISTWNVENEPPLEPKDLPNAFLKRLWLLSPDARSPCCKPPDDVLNNVNKSPEEMIDGIGGESQCAVNPLDLVTAIFMSANTFLQQEITVRMLQCHFAVPLVLPNIDPEEPSRFLLWPLRGAISRWMSPLPDNNKKVHEGDLASTHMPLVSCVKLGHCGISKSQVLNNVIGGLRSSRDTFLHRGMDGGELPHRLSNGLVEIGWYLPTGDTARDLFPVPVVISNLRGDLSTQDKYLSLLCQASSAVVVFCGNLGEKEMQLVASCKDMASKLILVDLSYVEKNENSVVRFVDQNLEKYMALPGVSVVQGRGLSEEELATKLSDTLKDMLPDELKSVSLEAAMKLAEELGFVVDEGVVCKKAMATVEEVLKGLDEGSAQFRLKQFPLQGRLWSKLAEIEKEESKQNKEGKEIDSQLQQKKKDILVELSTYKMTPAMKIFTNTLFTTDKVERAYFLSWMKLRLRLKQIEEMAEHHDELKNGTNDSLTDSDSFCTDSTFEEETPEELPVINCIGLVSDQQSDETSNKGSGENGISSLRWRQLDDAEVTQADGPELTRLDEQKLTLGKGDSISSARQQLCLDLTLEHPVASRSQHVEADPVFLGLEHFLREMGLIFELTHTNPSSGGFKALRLPSLATDLLIYGIPLEVMDGDASNIPVRWLGCVFAELKRRLPQEQCRTRVLTNLGVHHGMNAEVLSALFGVTFPEGRQRSTRGVYMVALHLPENLRKNMECDFLLLLDVEGLSSMSLDNNEKLLIHDNEMATVATGLSDVLMQNISSHEGTEFETNFTVMVNALLRIKELGFMPICQLLAQDDEMNSSIQALQLRRVSDMLQTDTGDIGTSNAAKQYSKTGCISHVKGPWYNLSLTEPIDKQYSNAVLKLKQNLFGALKQCAGRSEATGLPEFMSRLCAVWDAVKAESFSIGLQNTDTALAFSLLCTEISQWEHGILEHRKSWLKEATKKMFAVKASDATVRYGLLNELKHEASYEVKTEVDKLRSKIEAYLVKDNPPKMNTFRPILMSYMDDLQEGITEETIQLLGKVNENYCSSTQLEKFETLLEKEQESKLHALVENSKSTKVLLQDTELDKEFEDAWTKTLSNFDFRPSEKDDITARVVDILRENLINRGLQKHMNKLEVIAQNQTSGFQVFDEHFGYRSRLKHMFEVNNRIQMLNAQQVACSVIDEYKQFVADKMSLPADFSDSYITTLLENVEKALKETSIEIRSAFEVDLKVYLCRAACNDFQKLHDRFAKDSELLTLITATKSMYVAEFIYQFRKRDQCQRVAEAFTSMVIKPTMMDYVHRPLGMRIVKEIQSQVQQFQSPRTFHQSLLEELIEEDNFESFLEYLLSHEKFKVRKIQEKVMAHLSESTNLKKWRQQRLGEIVGKVAAAVSQTAEGTSGVLSDTKPLLERFCLNLESDGDVDVTRAPLNGPYFSITTKWDYFVTCLMELLAAMRLDLAEEFSENVEATQILKCLPLQPQECLYSQVRGCDQQCPLCRAPCELEKKGHELHKAVLHRPKGMLPHDAGSLSCINCPVSIAQDNPGMSKNAHGMSVAGTDLHCLYPDCSISSEDPNSQMPKAYWRYVLARFNASFAKVYERVPAKVPDEWQKITEEEALYSLRENFFN
uniref:GTPase, very large interferon inducible 1-like 2 n=2 Tax=Gasterosteus aculeatus aculeatus TaxID=481459 RepID=G3P494_GASAC|nr:interferon-induced very large GTPase 1 [Gasterosteus aculeatus aculeatus]